MKLAITVGLWCILSCISIGRALADEPAADETVTAIAPLGMTDAELGRPCSARFEPLIGRDARSVFPEAKTPRKANVSAWEHQFITFDSALQLRANARAFTVGGATSFGENKRVVIWRAIQLTHSIELDDTTNPRVVGEKGAFYVRRIFYGRTYEVVIIGDQEDFTARVRAELLAYGGGIDALKKKYRLQTDVRARGLRPKDAAIFARDEEELRAAYVEDPSYNSGKPTPVLVEYRRLPGVAGEDDSKIEWKQDDGSSPPDAVVQARILTVSGSNSDWSDTGLVAQDGDILIGKAFGKVTYAWGSSAEPGTADNGGLDFRFGTTVLPAGKSWATKVTAGSIKLRVRDNKHGDNKGKYTASVMLIPRAVLGTVDCKQVDANGTVVADCNQDSTPPEHGRSVHAPARDEILERTRPWDAACVAASGWHADIGSTAVDALLRLFPPEVTGAVFAHREPGVVGQLLGIPWTRAQRRFGLGLSGRRVVRYPDDPLR